MDYFTAGSKWGVRNAKVACVALSCIVGVSSSLLTAAEDLTKQETQRRVEQSLEAKKLVAIAEASYESGDAAGAVESYKKALALLPRANVSNAYADAVRENYAIAAIAYSGQLRRAGDSDKALKVIGELTAQEEFEGNKGVANAESEIYDPIRNNPSTTVEHTANVDKVRRLLYMAEGAYNLGDFDQATKYFNKVLLVDKHNSAARRGQQRVHKAVAQYARSASDEARARMLLDVDRAWEMIPASETFLGNPEEGFDGTKTAPVAEDIRYKLSRITIDRFDVEDITISGAVSRFRQLVSEADKTTDLSKKGVNINLNLGGILNEQGKAIAKRQFTMAVRNIPADKLLDLICKQSGTVWTANQFTATVLPAGQDVEQLYSRRFSVPPNFLTSVSAKAKPVENVFEELGEGRATRVNRTAVDYLKDLGVTFPEGSSANYIRNAGILIVRNNPANMAIVAKAIESIKLNQNVIVKVKLRVMDVLETDLQELGYDWILEHNKLGSSGNGVFVGGGNQGNGTGINPIQVAGQNSITSRPLTSGLRSGDGAFGINSLEGLINGGQRSSQTSGDLTRAPVIFQATNYLDEGAVQAMIRGVSQNKGVSSVWSPSVVTRPGEAARVENTRLFIYPTEYDPPELPDDVAQNAIIVPATPTSFEERAVGSTVELEPVVSADRRVISLSIDATFDEFLGFVDYGTPILQFSENPLTGLPVVQEYSPNSILMPVFEKVAAKTRISIYDGHTIAIGGMVRMDVAQVNDSVPVLSKLPFVGDYFKSSGTETIKRAIVIFATVELVDPQGNPWRDK